MVRMEKKLSNEWESCQGIPGLTRSHLPWLMFEKVPHLWRVGKQSSRSRNSLNAVVWGMIIRMPDKVWMRSPLASLSRSSMRRAETKLVTRHWNWLLSRSLSVSWKPTQLLGPLVHFIFGLTNKAYLVTMSFQIGALLKFSIAISHSRYDKHKSSEQ